jgi:chaperonin GroES
MNATPTEDRVILKLDHSDKTTDSGFIIPASSQPVPNQGEVMAVGPGKINRFGVLIPMDIKVGDMVVFSKEKAYGIEIDNEPYVTVTSDGILAVIDND